MVKDLALQLLDMYISQDKVPDILSMEWPNGEDLVIRFEWFSGESKDFGYSYERYKGVWEAFNQYWNSRGDPPKNPSKKVILFNPKNSSNPSK